MLAGLASTRNLIVALCVCLASPVLAEEMLYPSAWMYFDGR